MSAATQDVQIASDAQRGTHWQQRMVSLHSCDALEWLRKCPAAMFDAVISDPPFAGAGGISHGKTSRPDYQFFEYWFTDIARELIRVAKPDARIFLWCDWRTATIYDKAFQNACAAYDNWWVSQLLIHERGHWGMGRPFRNAVDYIAVIRGKNTEWGDRIPKNQTNWFSDYHYFGKHEHHPAEKSVAVAKRLVQWATDPGMKVLDPFAGGGTTGVACNELGRECVMVESNERFVQAIRARMEANKEAHQPSLGEV